MRRDETTIHDAITDLLVVLALSTLGYGAMVGLAYAATWGWL